LNKHLAHVFIECFAIYLVVFGVNGEEFKMADSGAIGSRLGRSASGCAVYFVLFVVVAFGLDHFMGERLIREARPWVGMASALFTTLGIASIWGLLTGYTRPASPHSSRAQLLINADTPHLPDRDGPLLVTGTVQLDSAMGDPLTSPIGGTACVAYSYRMYYVTSSASEHRREVPVYWGTACLPFRIASATARVRVLAVPRLGDTPQELELESDIERARAFIASTQFEKKAGIVGALGSAFEAADAMFAKENAAYRRDWQSKAQVLDPAKLILEESVLAVGATATVAGPWSATRQAIVPHIEGMDALTVNATTGSAEKIHLDDAGVSPSTFAGVVTALLLLAMGVGTLWAALALLGTKGQGNTTTSKPIFEAVWLCHSFHRIQRPELLSSL
jgi:hypothetical protein